MFAFISLILIYGISIGSAWYLTNKFKETCPEYNGTILWTLFFFPILFIVATGGTFLSSIFNLGDSNNLDILISLISLLICGPCIYFFMKEYNLLRNININNLDEIKKYLKFITLTYGIGIVMISILSSQYLTDMGIMIFSIVFLTTLIFLIWRSTSKKIEYFRKLLSGELYEEGQNSLNFAYPSQIDNQMDKDIKQETESSKEKLYKLKDLHDKGILTEAEFNSMKKEILEKGL